LADQPLAFVVQTRILDRDRRVRREQYGYGLVFAVELFGVDLLGEVQVAEHLAPAPDWNPEERFHRRMVGREPIALGVAIDVRGADRLWLADDQAEQPATLRQVADAVTLGLRHPRRDELAL